jgi:hypothetical protein
MKIEDDDDEPSSKRRAIATGVNPDSVCFLFKVVYPIGTNPYASRFHPHPIHPSFYLAQEKMYVTFSEPHDLLALIPSMTATSTLSSRLLRLTRKCQRVGIEIIFILIFKDLFEPFREDPVEPIPLESIPESFVEPIPEVLIESIPEALVEPIPEGLIELIPGDPAEPVRELLVDIVVPQEPVSRLKKYMDHS